MCSLPHFDVICDLLPEQTHGNMESMEGGRGYDTFEQAILLHLLRDEVYPVLSKLSLVTSVDCVDMSLHICLVIGRTGLILK